MVSTKNKWVLCSLIGLKTILVYFNLYCQDFLSPTFIKIDKSTGLASNCIYDANEDVINGNIYFSTDKGISIFDGKHFKNHYIANILNDSEVFRLKKDLSGRIWFATSNSSIGILDNNNISIVSNLKKNKKLKNFFGWVNSITISSDSSVWFGTFSGQIVVFSKNKTIKKVIDFGDIFNNPIKHIKNRIISNIYHKNKSAFFFTSEFGLVKINNQFEVELLKHKRDYNRVYCLSNDSIFGIKEDSLFLDINGICVKKIKSDFVLGEISQIERIGNKIFFTNGKVYFNTDINLKNVSQFFRGEGLDKIQYVQNNIIITSIKNGLYILKNDERFYKESSKDSIFRALFYLESNKSLWCGGDFGVLLNIKGNEIARFLLNYSNKYSLGRIFDISLLFEGVIGISFERNFAIYDILNKKFIFYPIGSKCHSSNGENIVIGFSNNCFVFSKNKILDDLRKYKEGFVAFNPLPYGVLPGFRTFSSNFINFNLVFLSTDNGIVSLDLHGNHTKVLKRYHNGLSFKYILKFDSNRIWTYNDKESLKIIDSDSGVEILDLSFRIGNRRVNRVRRVDSTQFWICSDSGLILAGVRENSVGKSLQCYLFQDVFLKEEVFDIISVGQNWWIATSNGLLVMPQNFHLPRNEPAPHLSFHSFFVNGLDSARWASRSFTGTTKVSFSFGCLSLQHLGNLKFRYRLSPDAAWIYTDAFDHELNNLSFGDYRIEIQAKSPYSVWSASMFLPSFELLPPLWERSWFLMLVSFVFFSMVLALVYNFQRIRIARLQLEAEMTDASLRSLRSQMKPHFLSNILNSMYYFILNEKPEESGTFVSSFSRLVRHMLESSDKNYLPVPAELSQVQDYVAFECRRADRTVFLRLHFQSDADFSSVLIPSMLLQPILENCLMHGLFPLSGHKGQIDIRLGIVDSPYFRQFPSDGIRISNSGRLLVQVLDNGQGRESSRKNMHKRYSQSYALRVMAERLHWIERKYHVQAEMQVMDLKNPDGSAAGTAVVFNLPLMEKIRPAAGTYPGRSEKLLSGRV